MTEGTITIEEALDILHTLRHERAGNTSSFVGSPAHVEKLFQFIVEDTQLHNGGNITYMGDYRGQKLDLRKSGAKEIGFFTDIFKCIPYKPDVPSENEQKLIDALEARFKKRDIELY